MTGFATLTGDSGPWNWAWEIRSVNARGMDLRLRLPETIESLDAKVRAAVGKVVKRGNVSVGLRLNREASVSSERLDPEALDRVLARLAEINSKAEAAGLTLAETSAAEILSLRGVMVSDTGDLATDDLGAAITADLPVLLAAFDDMRAAEGAALRSVLLAQLDRIEALTGQAADVAQARKEQMAARLRENLARVLDNADGADPDRVAQELAVIAVKSDVTEEIDRLHAHVNAARALLTGSEPVGRKLDFLSQEFNREANTLCSKAQNTELTALGLDLKATIDQMREQVQNVE